MPDASPEIHAITDCFWSNFSCHASTCRPNPYVSSGRPIAASRKYHPQSPAGGVSYRRTSYFYGQSRRVGQWTRTHRGVIWHDIHDHFKKVISSAAKGRWGNAGLGYLGAKVGSSATPAGITDSIGRTVNLVPTLARVYV